MFESLFGDNLQHSRKSLVSLDNFANSLIHDLNKKNISEAKAHIDLILKWVVKLNRLADGFFNDFRIIKQTVELKNLTESNGVIFKHADGLRREINSLAPQNATEEKLSLIKSHAIQLDKNIKLAETLAEWVKNNEKFIKAPAKKEVEISDRIVCSSVAAENIRHLNMAAIGAQLRNILRNINNDNWKKKKTKSFNATDLLGLELRGQLRLTYYEAAGQIRICQIYFGHSEYDRHMDGDRKRVNYSGFTSMREVLEKLAA